jgi:hypothetical protein
MRPWGASDGQVIDRYGLHWLIGFENDHNDSGDAERGYSEEYWANDETSGSVPEASFRARHDGERPGTRTLNLEIKSLLLCQLS